MLSKSFEKSVLKRKVFHRRPVVKAERIIIVSAESVDIVKA